MVAVNKHVYYILLLLVVIRYSQYRDYFDKIIPNYQNITTYKIEDYASDPNTLRHTNLHRQILTLTFHAIDLYFYGIEHRLRITSNLY